jgi:hypothetical protein
MFERGEMNGVNIRGAPTNGFLKMPETLFVNIQKTAYKNN